MIVEEYKFSFNNDHNNEMQVLHFFFLTEKKVGAHLLTMQ